MFYTRDPIILTTLSSKEGYKLIIKSSSNIDLCYQVERISVVDYSGNAFYIIDTPYDMMLPVGSFYVVEEKEKRVSLKTKDKQDKRRKGSPRKKKSEKIKAESEKSSKSNEKVESVPVIPPPEFKKVENDE